MVVNQVCILFLMILIGFCLRKKQLLNTELNNGLVSLLLTVTVPFTIINSFLHIKYSVTVLHQMAIAFGGVVFIHFLATLLGWLFFRRYPAQTRNILWFAVIFSNSGFMGLPVLESLYGKPGVFYGSIYIVVFNLLVWTLGVYLFEGKMDLKSLKQALLNPAIIAVAIGFILFAFSIKPLTAIATTLEMVAGTTTPLSMIVIGSMLADLKLAEFFDGLTVYYGSLARLLIVPLMGLPIFRLMGLPVNIYRVILMTAAMPVGTMTAILAEKYGADTSLASRLVVISTALSILTIPLISLLI